MNWFGTFVCGLYNKNPIWVHWSLKPAKDGQPKLVQFSNTFTYVHFVQTGRTRRWPPPSSENNWMETKQSFLWWNLFPDYTPCKYAQIEIVPTGMKQWQRSFLMLPKAPSIFQPISRKKINWYKLSFHLYSIFRKNNIINFIFDKIFSMLKNH